MGRVIASAFTAFFMVLSGVSIASAQDAEAKFQESKVTGGGGITLNVQEWGNPQGLEILFIHGFSQNHLSWINQVDSALAADFRMITFDLRGHGMSEKQTSAYNYNDSRPWADDVAAIIEAMGLQRPVLVGWSYGGFIILDYLRHYGGDEIAGIDFVGAATRLGTEERNKDYGEEILSYFGETLSSDAAVSIAAMRRFVRDVTAQPMSPEDYETTLAFNMMVPSGVRLAMASRDIDNDDVLPTINVATLVTHGVDDKIVLLRSGEHIVELVPHATTSYYDGVGHATFLEDAARFNRELAGFVRKANGK